MDNHFPDDMSYWTKRSKLEIRHHRKAETKFYYKFVTYFDVWNFPQIDRYKKTTYFLLGFPVYRKVIKINL